jgi:hypothetical protein
VARLRSQQRREVGSLLELVRLGAGVRQVSLLVQPFGYLHGLVRREAQMPRGLLLQLDRVERGRPPPLLLMPVHARHHGHPTLHANLIQHHRALPVEQTVPRPAEDGAALLPRAVLDGEVGALLML